MLDIADLFTKEFTLLRELFLGCELAREGIVKEGHDQGSHILQVIDEHDIAQLLLKIVITAFIWKIVLLIALYTGSLAILCAAECFSDELIEGLQMVLDPLVLLLRVVLSKQVQVFLSNEVW